MAIRLSSAVKSRVQSFLPALSFGLARQRTESLLSGVAAVVLGIRGCGWSPSVLNEAKGAARWVNANEDFVVIDAGANVGSWMLAVRKYLPKSGRIYAFEPQPRAAEIIRALRIHGCEVQQAALSDRSGTIAFYTSDPTDTMGSLYERDDTIAHDHRKGYESIEVETLRLDDFVKKHGVNRIDFMKMDLEGAELQALHGATECMQSGLLRALSFEFGVSNVNSRTFFRDYFRLLSEHSYQIFRMTPAGHLIHVAEYSEDLEFFARTTTYFARKT